MIITMVSQEWSSQMYQCIPVALTLYINAYDFIFEKKKKKTFAKEIYLYIFIEGNIHEISKYVRSEIREKICTKEK